MKVGRNESSRSSSTRSGGIRRRRGDQWCRNCDCFQRHDLGDPCAGHDTGTDGDQDPVAGPLRSIRPHAEGVFSSLQRALIVARPSWRDHHIA